MTCNAPPFIAAVPQEAAWVDGEVWDNSLMTPLGGWFFRHYNSSARMPCARPVEAVSFPLGLGKQTERALSGFFEGICGTPEPELASI